MGQEVVAVALEIVADEGGVVTVGDEADALGQERILDLDLLETDRSLLAGDLGELRDLVDEIALGHAPHREGELGAERQAVEDRNERKADESGRKGAAEDHDHRVIGDEHPEIAAQEDKRGNHHDSAKETEARRDVHGKRSERNTWAAAPHKGVYARLRRAMGGALWQTSPSPLKGGLPRR